MTYRQIIAIQKANKKKILALYPNALDESGIYIFARIDEEGFKFAYIGQAKQVLTRLAQHLTGYQHIDNSIKKHKLFSEKNPYGWKIDGIIYCTEDMLDEKEREYIKLYHTHGYQLKNDTTGGQGKGKRDIAEKNRKGYREGLKNGYNNARRDIANLFTKHLNVSVKKAGNKNHEKAMNKFLDFVDLAKERTGKND